MNAIILSIGDELILGQTVDTNSAWLSTQLAALGCPVIAHITVSDDQPAIEQAISEATERTRLILITGGIGPTEDDLTRQALAKVMGVDLVLDDDWLGQVQGFFTRMGRTMPASNRIQAMIPRGAKALQNTCGTAAGIHATLATDPQSDVFVMPGVPKEMKAMFTRDILPFLSQRSGGAAILSRTLHTFGMGESAIAEKLGDLMRRDRNPSVGTTVSGGVVSLRINSRFDSRRKAEEQLEQTEKTCRGALGDLVYGADEQTLAEAVGALLKAKHQTVATAESCTGGLLAKMLTDQSGSSEYFRQGWITYSNEAKQQQIGVSGETLAQHGAVSEPVALQMAAGARERAATDFALSITGIAGPTGATPTKPVGTVCIALATPQKVAARTFVFPGDREMVRDRSAKMALTLLRYHLLGKTLPF